MATKICCTVALVICSNKTAQLLLNHLDIMYQCCQALFRLLSNIYQCCQILFRFLSLAESHQVSAGISDSQRPSSQTPHSPDSGVLASDLGV